MSQRSRIDVRRIKEQIEEYAKKTEEYISLTDEYVTRTEELMGEIQRRLKILDGVAVILEKYSDFSDSDQVLDEIRSIMNRYLEARAYVKRTSDAEDAKPVE